MSTYWKSTRSIIILGIFFVFLSGIAFAGDCGPDHDHDGGGSLSMHEGMSDQMPMMMNRPVQSVEVGKTRISLDVMDMAMHVHMQAMKQNPLPGTYDAKKSHAIMVMIKDLATNNTVKNDLVTVTVVSPSGETETSRASWYGDHYGESFTPSENGTYKIRVKAMSKKGIGQEAEFKYEKV